ncbi:transcriptional regulator [Streptosporangium sp. NBC_01810]|uniref:transcriptional regulator n=1 Tax=Streptosporangium sp. NBC_01810 TaxID=2975951 RepID=UPI002DDB3C83|nr:transcriptional regulator [Streptosporangium sp. NBC_01810]WSA25395.1 transcriptional regulator [Streptosporangium sp. NBC_01810]
MPRESGNVKLKAARQHAGYASQQALADALARAGVELGEADAEVSIRQVRRWESATPPWPHAVHQRLLEHTLGMSVEQLGFTPPWGGQSERQAAPVRSGAAAHPIVLPLPPPAPTTTTQPAALAVDYAAVTRAHRRLYWRVQPPLIRSAAAEHARFGAQLLSEVGGMPRRALAAALAESLLLVGRIEFFDLRQPVEADAKFVEALQAAGAADDQLLGAAILGHSAFVPGWAGDRDGAAERLRAARAYARRADSVPASFTTWLYAVEAECETRCGKHREALRVIGQAEDTLAGGDETPLPEWFDWFSPVRLASFKGNTQLKAGHLPQARQTLLQVLENLPEEHRKQRTVVLGDLAAVAVAEGDPEAACARAVEALDQLSITWYATGMDRIREVRRALEKWGDRECVTQLDDRLYEWRTTLIALQR